LTAVQAAEEEADATRAAALGSATTLSALRQARDNAAAVRDRVAVERERLDLERRELEAEAERAGEARRSAEDALGQARANLERSRAARQAADEQVSRLRSERTGLAEVLAERRRTLAGVEARLRSLEQLEAGRAGFGDAARLLLADDGLGFPTEGALADHVEVERSYERAVDALLGDLLRHVVVRRAEDVSRAIAVLAEHEAGRCGFVMLDELARSAPVSTGLEVPAGARAMASVVRARGPVEGVGDRVFFDAFIAETFDAARALSRTASVPVAAMTGEVFRAGWRVEGGGGEDVRGILETRAEIASLRKRVAADGSDVDRLAGELREVDAEVPAAEERQAQAMGDLHEQEKGIVGLEAQVARASDDAVRLTGRLEVVKTERRRTDEEEQATTLRRDEASAAITEHEERQRDAEGRLDAVLAALQTGRDEAEARLHVVTEARTASAALAERSSALEAEVVRLAEAADDLEARQSTCRTEIERIETRRRELQASIGETERMLDTDVHQLGGLQQEVRGLDERVVAFREEVAGKDRDVRGARQVLDGVRAELMQSEVIRATAASDLAHLATACAETLDASREDVVREVATMEDAGELVAPARRVAAASEPDEDEGVEAAETEPAVVAPDAADAREMTAEDVIAYLREKIERLGPVNMMAIEQFDELETRHEFLTTQRKDLLDSIEKTGEAIRKIDKTTHERFAEAFASINTHFQSTFATLFGGGRAGLVLIDQENDPESGVDIIAQPPGKRLQNVQLLSGGEKALSAMALMFAIFKHRPSPFCLLDEIDAPLDDANIGRFVEMLQGMQDHTQFILVTHNRKTMEIANRLYGVTMEEPGVSKLISLQLN
jgi:chromosome segregation protein